MVWAGVHEMDGIVAFHLIEEDIDPRDEVLVGDRLDGPSGKELHTVHAVGYDVVARGNVRIQVPALLLDPVKGVEHGTEFAGVARGSPSAKPSRVGGGRGHGSPYRPGRGFSRGGDVNTPASRPLGRAEPSVKRKAVGASNRGSPGPVDLAIYSSAFFRVENLFTSAGIPTV